MPHLPTGWSLLKGQGLFLWAFLFLAWSLMLGRCPVTVWGRNEWMRPVSSVSDPVPVHAEVESLWNKFWATGNQSLSTGHSPWSCPWTVSYEDPRTGSLNSCNSPMWAWGLSASPLPSLSMEMSDRPPSKSPLGASCPCLLSLFLSEESRFRVFPRAWPPPPE